MQTLLQIEIQKKVKEHRDRYRRRWLIACAVYALTILILGLTVKDGAASKLVAFFAILGIPTTFVTLRVIFGVKFNKD